MHHDQFKLRTNTTQLTNKRDPGVTFLKNKDSSRKIHNNFPVKIETNEDSEAIQKLNLDKFKFQKKPHIKIEFEKYIASPKDESKQLWEPPNWREFLINLKNMRANKDAPVDSMGCHMTMDENAAPEIKRYQSLIALMLSSQTKDQVTFAAMERLRAHGLTVDNILNMTNEELGQLIYPVGFWKTKVKYIKKTTQTLKELYNGDIPDTVEKLCKLTGVGPKMAHICMKVAWDKVTGIGVDTHVHRISNRIGWVKKPTATPEDTRKALEGWLPCDLWSEVNHLMVGFGQTICLPVGPICNECLNNDICPSSGKGCRSPKKSPNKNILTKPEMKSEVDVDFEDKKDSNLKSFTSKIPKKKKVTLKKEALDTNILGNTDSDTKICTQKRVKASTNDNDCVGFNPSKKRQKTSQKKKLDNKNTDFDTKAKKSLHRTVIKSQDVSPSVIDVDEAIIGKKRSKTKKK